MKNVWILIYYTHSKKLQILLYQHIISKMNFKIKAIFYFFIFLLSAESAFAGPPYETDDAQPTDYKHWEIYASSSYAYSSIDGKSYGLPELEIDYGIIPNGQLSVNILNELNLPPSHLQEAHYGYGDSEIGMKYRFIQETSIMPEIAIFPSVLIPTGNNNEGLGNGKSQTFLPVWIEKNFDSWRIYGGGGYWFNAGIGNKNWVYNGLAVEHDLNKQLTLGGEFFHRTADRYDDKGSSGFTAGVTYNINERYHILFSAGRDVQGPRRFISYLAFEVSF